MGSYYDNGTSSLYCGDCLDAMSEMEKAGVMVDKVITSPPYNTARNQPDRRYDIHRDGMSSGEYADWLASVVSAIGRILRPNGCILMNMSYGADSSESMIVSMARVLERTEFTMADILVWKKPNAWPNNMSSNKTTRVCEFVFVLCRRSEYDTFTSNKRLSSVKENGQRVYVPMMNLFEAPNGNSIDENHSTFSIGFVRELIRRYVVKGDVVMDPFNGSGTTMAACDCMGIRGYYSELSESQCRYAVERLSAGGSPKKCPAGLSMEPLIDMGGKE